MQIIISLITVALSIFQIIAGLSGIIGGIILIFSGDWLLALYMLGLAATAPFVLGLVMVPSLIFAGPSGMLLERGQKFFGNVLALLAGVWIAIVFGCYSTTVLFYVFGNASSLSLIHI